MKKSKIIALTLGTVGLAAVGTATAVALTSCSDGSVYSPDTNTRIIDIFPDKKTFDAISYSYSSKIDETINDMWSERYGSGSFMTVKGNWLVLQANWYELGRLKKVRTIEHTFIFSQERTVEHIRKDKIGKNPQTTSKKLMGLEDARSLIYSITGYKGSY